MAFQELLAKQWSCFLAAGGGGNQAQFTASAFESGTVVTAAMAATTAPSDRLSEGVALQSLYFLGLLLFVITLLLNLVADRFVRRVTNGLLGRVMALSTLNSGAEHAREKIAKELQGNSL